MSFSSFSSFSSFTEVAAPLPGEADLLAGVVANLRADLPKLVYADWLEERSDPRGPFLRDFVEAMRAGTKLPPAIGSRCWNATVGTTLARLATVYGFAPHLDDLFALARPMLRVVTDPSDDDSIPVGATKFGGCPDLPALAGWPRVKRGPLTFLAQFDLADIRENSLAGRLLPESGLLSFFVYHDIGEDILGEDIGKKGRLVTLTSAKGPLVRMEFPDDLPAENQAPACEVLLREGLDLPPLEMAVRRKTLPANLELGDCESYARLLGDLRDWGSVLLGYSHATATDDPTPGSDWLQLAAFASDDNLNWNWRDDHTLFWHVLADDLAHGRFDRVQAADG